MLNLTPIMSGIHLKFSKILPMLFWSIFTGHNTRAKLLILHLFECHYTGYKNGQDQLAKKNNNNLIKTSYC